jgi:outer membrane protein assembly factor BamE (lipoprotein component of BamABCDE complex)
MVAWGAMVLSGCLVIPGDYHAKYSRHNISDKTQLLLQPGVTTKEEVFLLLGEPDHASDDGQNIGYGWTKVKAVYVVLGQFTADAGEIKRYYVLQIKFDSDNRVVAVDVTKEWIPLR